MKFIIFYQIQTPFYKLILKFYIINRDDTTNQIEYDCTEKVTVIENYYNTDIKVRLVNTLNPKHKIIEIKTVLFLNLIFINQTFTVIATPKGTLVKDIREYNCPWILSHFIVSTASDLQSKMLNKLKAIYENNN